MSESLIKYLMEFNSLFFPAPASTYTYTALKNELIYIPKNHMTKESQTGLSYIPCLYIPVKARYRTKSCLFTFDSASKTPRHKILLYFHGNAEDIGHSYEFLKDLSSSFRVTVLAMEYPGYGIYRQEQASADLI